MSEEPVFCRMHTCPSRVGSAITGVDVSVTALEAENHIREELSLLAQLKSVLKNPKDVVAAAKALIDDKHVLEKKLEAVHHEQANVLREELARKVVRNNGETM